MGDFKISGVPGQPVAAARVGGRNASGTSGNGRVGDSTTSTYAPGRAGKSVLEAAIAGLGGIANPLPDTSGVLPDSVGINIRQPRYPARLETADIGPLPTGEGREMPFPSHVPRPVTGPTIEE